ncbi:hypothetical protein IEQ34_014077 [Dendrobium chrysotoxum]|uniref:DUF4378 domain-containing protein n=1 Tax=Dendrobium chrysotoxum TaxID=161865 RepID=A0AAV7GK68_DENCH|nr:hypothetical protein IEQ34_014077 [Dendrobium chrysotoxum]
MLIAQEWSSAFESKETSPGVVAKLMGLSKLPIQQKVQTSKRKLQEIDSHDSLNRSSQDYWLPKECSCNHQMHYRSECCMHEKCKDVYKVKQYLSSNGQVKNHYLQHEDCHDNLQHEDCHDNLMDKRMALVHEKFIIAKRLATNKRLIQSKEFKDALEVLSSNKDLFLRFLEEPNSLISKQLEEIQQIISLGSQTKRITVLKPTTSFDSDHDKSMSKNGCACDEEIKRNIDVHGWSSTLSIPKAETRSQPTRIVVLKPSPTAIHETKANMASNVAVSVQESRHRSGNWRTDDDIRSREVAMEITQQIQKDMASMQKDEYPSTAFSSTLYLADESKLTRPENDCREERGSNYSDSELVTPTSPNSCVHVKSINPISVTSCSNQSYSAESIERQKYKKRLSERWEIATLSDNSHEQADIKKISSTLGDILANPEVKNEEEVVDRLAISPWVSCGQVQDTSIVGTCLPTSWMQESSEDCLKNITRLKTLPASECHKNICVNEEISCTSSSKSILLEESSNLKKGKSFKEKVSSLFFSRMKKLVKDKPKLYTSVSSDGSFHSASYSSINDSRLSNQDGISDEDTSKTLEEDFFKVSSPPVSVNCTERNGNAPLKGIRSIEKVWKSEISRENFSQHSPISVLERPFQEEFSNSFSLSSQHATTGRTETLSRSPLIGSASRSTYSENAHSVNIAAPNSLKLSKLFSKEDKEQEQLDFIHKLISSSNLANESSTTVLAKSHSLDCPLDPILLDDLLEREGEETKYREKRSNQKLLFDYVSFALKEIGYSSLVNAYPWSTTTTMARIKTSPTVTDAVLCRVKDCFSEEEICTSAEHNKQFVDNLVKKEVIRSGLAEPMWLEMDDFSKEIGEKMLDELFDDALADLIGCCLC